MSRLEERLVKVVLPVGLIRELDAMLVAGVGGYTTRAEFIREAVESLLLELGHQPAPPEPVLAAAPGAGLAQAAMPAAQAPAISLQDTRLTLEGPSVLIDEGDAYVPDAPLFGLHNRDYPSLWVAHRLARKTLTGLVPVEAFVEETIGEAWTFASSLRPLELATGARLTALFPTNEEKPQSASEGFAAFAMGSMTVQKDGRVRADGPLFTWRVCQVRRAQDGLLIGLTPAGYELLETLNGISLDLPHGEDLARRFLAHLREFAPGDWWGLSLVLASAADQPDRRDLVDRWVAARPDWSPSVASTMAQGYVARAREWGLLHPKLIGGRYVLTGFGEAQVQRLASGDLSMEGRAT